jgi:biopolymer transport protein ExbD
MAKETKVAAGDVSVNLTPMIDCTFQLIIFFILTTQFASAALAPLLPPKPEESVASEPGRQPGEATNKLIVNVVSQVPPDAKTEQPRRARVGKHYYIAGHGPEGKGIIQIGDTGTLKRIFEQELGIAMKGGVKEEDFQIEVRADKRVQYSYVQPVINAAAQAGIGNMKITALVAGG